jgi:hypothetical protein
MATDKENFETWFARPLERPYPNKDFGFIILMSTLPLLERYVRRKENIQSDNLGGTWFYDRFTIIFPEVTAQLAIPFWKACRHGLLHESRFITEWSNRPVYAVLLHGVPTPIAVNSKDPLIFFVEPEHFSSRVLQTIRNDFGVYSLAGELPTTMISQDSIEATLSTEAKAPFSSLNIRFQPK